MIVIESMEDLLSAVKRCTGLPPPVIGVDGLMGAGKTTVATHIADNAEGLHIGLDAYTRSDGRRPGYVRTLLLDRLERDLQGAAQRGRRVVIEGICLRRVLLEIGIEARFNIYLKRVGVSGQWHDVERLSPSLPRGEEGEYGLYESEHDYHIRYRPHERADVLFQWKDPGLPAI